MIPRTKAIALKELKQLLRDKRFLFVLIFFPVFYLGLFGYAVNFDVHHIKLAVYDQDRSEESRSFINSMLASQYFDLTIYITNDSEVREILNDKDAQIVMVIPVDFSEKLFRKENAKVQFLVDGVDGNTAIIISNYVNGAAQNYNGKFQPEILAQVGAASYLPIELETRFWFNPSLESTKFFVPGLIAMILIVTAIVSVSLSLVREKERGTIEQINVSSINIIELLVGKSLPYVIIALIDAAFILIVGYLLFDVVVQGNLLLLFFCTLIFIFASTSIGVFVSVVADTQQVAFSMAIFISLLPSVILSGFVFPIESMPWIIQILTNVTPAKFFIRILRAIILRGVGVQAFWDQLIYLTLFIFFFLGLAAIVSKRKEKTT
ncbi:MAG: multidrug ABC transporter permease [Ignavibacteria bacterium RBG_13_36_8]|nr:MAG: multidrug ABC transporter permease [Ignavibacteria bacterium RBG_13_36_8]